MVDAGNAGWKLMIVIYASACALHVQLRWRNIGHGGIVHMQYAEKVEETESGKDHVVLMRDSFIVASSILHCICFSWHPIATNRTAPDSRTSGKTATATATSPNSALQVLATTILHIN